MSFLKTIADLIIDAVKDILQEYARETEAAIKKKFKRVVVTVLFIGVLSVLGILLVGSASIFLLIGSLEYLSNSMPRWEAWEVMGLVSGVIGGMLFFALFLFVRRELGSE